MKNETTMQQKVWELLQPDFYSGFKDSGATLGKS